MTPQRFRTRAVELAADLTNQFAYYFTKDGVEMVSTGGLSDLESAFDFFGLPDPCKLGQFRAALAQTYEPVPESHAESQCPCLPMRIGCGCPCHVGPTSLAALQAAVWEETDNYLHVCEERITYAQRAPDFEIRARLNELLLAVQDLRQRRKALIEALRPGETT